MECLLGTHFGKTCNPNPWDQWVAYQVQCGVVWCLRVILHRGLTQFHIVPLSKLKNDSVSQNTVMCDVISCASCWDVVIGPSYPTSSLPPTLPPPPPSLPLLPLPFLPSSLPPPPSLPPSSSPLLPSSSATQPSTGSRGEKVPFLKSMR